MNDLRIKIGEEFIKKEEEAVTDASSYILKGTSHAVLVARATVERRYRGLGAATLSSLMARQGLRPCLFQRSIRDSNLAAVESKWCKYVMLK